MPQEYTKDEINQLIFHTIGTIKKDYNITDEEFAELEQTALFLTSPENIDIVQFIINKVESGDKNFIDFLMSFFKDKLLHH